MSRVHCQFDLVTSRALARSLSRDTRRYRVVIVPSSSLSFSAVMRMGLWVLMLVKNCVSSEDYSFHPRHHGVTGGEK